MLHTDGVEIVEDVELVKHIAKFYKDLSDAPNVTSIELHGLECNRLSKEDRKFMTNEVGLEEIKEVALF